MQLIKDLFSNIYQQCISPLSHYIWGLIELCSDWLKSFNEHDTDDVSSNASTDDRNAPFSFFYSHHSILTQRGSDDSMDPKDPDYGKTFE